MLAEDLDTPFLMLDLDGLEDNLDRYQRYFDQHGIGLRPHIKTHKCLAVAHMQMSRGASGITCQKLGEAEVMVGGGVDGDVLIPFNIIGKQKLDRLMSLTRIARRVTVAVDSEYTARGLSEAAKAAEAELGVIIELGMGGRCGVETASGAAELAAVVDSLPGVELRGIMAMPSPPGSRPFFQETLALMDKSGLPHPIVSGGSTPGAFEAHEIPELTEYRAGEYPVGGAKHLQNGTHTLAQCALRVVMTVVSRPTETRAILDGGSKSLSACTMDADGRSIMGHIVEYPEANFNGASEEHGHVDVSACAAKPKIGGRVQVLPVHPCPTVNEHDEIVAVRQGRVEAIWPVHARGRIR